MTVVGRIASLPGLPLQRNNLWVEAQIFGDFFQKLFLFKRYYSEYDENDIPINVTLLVQSIGIEVGLEKRAFHLRYFQLC